MNSLVSTNGAIGSAQRILEVVQQEVGIARAIEEGTSPLTMNKYQKQNILRSQLIKHAWQRIGRQVLAMHPAIVDEVAVAGSDKIPGAVFRTLPYMNPLVVFAQPPVFKSWRDNEASMRLLGFFVYGTSTVTMSTDDSLNPRVSVEQRIYTTTDTNAERLGILMVLEVLDEFGKVLAVEFDSVSSSFNVELTLAETVDAQVSRFHWDDDDQNANARRRKWMRQVFGVIFGSLFYLCSTTLEAESVPRSYVGKRIPQTISRKPLSLFKVGWTTGAALTRYRQLRNNGNPSVIGAIEHEQDPQHRRSHFKMQPCGQGRQDRKLIFVSAYWTHIERLGEQGTNVVRGVPRAGKAGSVRQSVRTALAATGPEID